jgi:hypothetical protein
MPTRQSFLRSIRTAGSAVCAALLLSGAAQASDDWEFWPELAAFVPLGQDTRLYLDASYGKGKESLYWTLDAAAYLDISLKPIVRKSLASTDWRRSKYLWARVGYDRVFKTLGGNREETSENRGILAVYGRLELPKDVWLEGRARVDLRWIGGDYSTRYRAKLDVSKEFNVLGHPVVPYLNAEAFYDDRYDGWSRMLYTAGTEVTVSRHFRFEIYLARQKELLPADFVLNGFGMVAKWYF